MEKFQILSKTKNYRTRASFKLLQIDKKINFLKFSYAIIDLCCAPGGWLQICKQKTHPYTLILGIDIVKIPFLQGIYFLKKNIIRNRTINLIKSNFSFVLFETIIHDGSPNIGSNKNLDYFNQNKLAYISLKYCASLLAFAGNFITKFFFSRDVHAYLFIIKKIFMSTVIYKPATSRYKSSEIYILCLSMHNLNFNYAFFKRLHYYDNRILLKLDFGSTMYKYQLIKKNYFKLKSKKLYLGNIIMYFSKLQNEEEILRT